MTRAAVFRQGRVLSLLVLNLLFFALVIFRLFTIQVKDHDRFLVLAAEQHRDWIELPAERGKIYSRNGFPLVDNQLAYLVYGEPQKITDVKAVTERLAEALDDGTSESEQTADSDFGDSKQREAERLKKILEQNLQWVPLAHRVSPEAKQKIEAPGAEGIGFAEEPKRFYPEGRLAANVLGFVGSDERGRDVGYYGLEGYYDGDLGGRAGKIVQEKGAFGEPIPVGGYRKIPAEDGRDLVLTIDRTLQFIVEKNLNRAVKDYGALGGVVIIMEPRTGAILAMASSPTYDPLKPFTEEETASEEDADNEPWKIDPIAHTYEPGSVLKALTMSAAIDTNTVKPQTTFMDSGPITVSGYTVDNWDGKHHGEESMIEVLQHSNNMGAAWVAQKLGAEVLRDYFLRFGLGRPTGIDLEGEDTGIVKKLSEWRPIDLVTASFGQGVSVTPLQLTRIFAAIANGGKLVKPFVVLELRDADRVIKVKPEVVGRPISKKTAEIMVEMLTAAVEGGESKYYNIKTHKVAGKTGTAQIPVGGKYDPRKTNATFVGFLPGDPRFVMLAMLRQPSSSIYAAETAVPLWMDIARELIVYYGIEPDK